MPGEMVAAEIFVSGLVQGVGYRYFTVRLAERLGVSGWSMNMPDGRVRLEIEADSSTAGDFIEELWKGPSMSDVSDVAVTWKPYEGRSSGFTIRM